MRLGWIMLTLSVVLSFGCAYLNELESWATWPTGIWALVSGFWAFGRLAYGQERPGPPSESTPELTESGANDVVRSQRDAA